ncbi:MAG: hypothetical protein SGI77_24945 [Pirellulaceae bacterium]|nr:hypothetical protein [Pirellulaceae bacterium]
MRLIKQLAGAYLVIGSKAVAEIWLTNETMVRSKDEVSLVYKEYNMGDHIEGWVLYLRDGFEESRYNARHLVSIEWAKPPA